MFPTTTQRQQQQQQQEQIEGLWLFGYGSLIWKGPPHHDKRIPGYIEGYVRRFWQASEDHRGVPGAPGRVATLLTRSFWETLVDEHPTAPTRVWGAAYHIPPSHVQVVKEYLDIREINGYSIDYVPFHTSVPVPSGIASNPSVAESKASPEDAPAPINCLVYIGLPSNPQFVGPESSVSLAKHIVKSRGPSGENKEYVYMLEEALEGLRKDMGMKSTEEVDDYIVDLARRVREEETKLNGA